LGPRPKRRFNGPTDADSTANSNTLRVFDTQEEAQAAHTGGLLRLFRLQFAESLKYFEKNLPGLLPMAMQYMTLGSMEELRTQLIDVALRRACLGEPWPADAAAFRRRCAEAKPRLGLLAQEICRLAGTVLTEWQAVQKKLPAFKVHAAAVQDIEKQLGRLIGKRFIADTPFERLQHFPRYLKAVVLRLDKLRTNPARDAQLMAEYAPLWNDYARRATVLAKQDATDPQVEQFRWLLEELRVQLFAQELRTPAPVSVKRLRKMGEQLT
jgi:ATP-dependent helicase HrpA